MKKKKKLKKNWKKKKKEEKKETDKEKEKGKKGKRKETEKDPVWKYLFDIIFFLKKFSMGGGHFVTIMISVKFRKKSS